MAAAKKRASQRGNNRGGGGGLPGWAMLTIGLIIGLFVAFLVYLDDLEPQERDVASVDEAEPVAPDEEDERPRFEFYSILPELEVMVPDFGGDDDDGSEDDGGEDEAAGGEIADPPVEGPESGDDEDTRYFLQVGSFQEDAKADEMKAEITLLGLDATIRTIEVDGEDWHRVRAGPFDDQSALEDAQDRLREEGIDALVLRASAE